MPHVPDPAEMSPEIAHWWARAISAHRRYLGARDAAGRAAPAEVLEVAAQRLVGLARTIAAPLIDDAGALDDVLDALGDVQRIEADALASARLVKAIRVSDRRHARAGRLRDRLEPAAQGLADRWAAAAHAVEQDALVAEAETLESLPADQVAADHYARLRAAL